MISNIVLTLEKYPGWLTAVEKEFGKEVADQCERYHDALIEGQKLAESFYFEIERVRVRDEMKVWIEEMKEFSEECRLRRRSEQEECLLKAKQKLSELLEHRGESEKKKKMMDGIKRMERILKSDITPEKIEQAKNFPISELLHIERGMAKCINHEDRNPSMNCKNNFVYCHSCGFHADAIGVFMKLNGCGFGEAVNSLTK